MLYRGPAGLLVGRRPVSHRMPYRQKRTSG
jgi:hypothetical protein